MIGYISILYLILFVAYILTPIPVGYLLVGSIFIFLDCLITLFSKVERLTEFGKIVFIVSIFGLVVSICSLNGINIAALFN